MRRHDALQRAAKEIYRPAGVQINLVTAKTGPVDPRYLAIQANDSPVIIGVVTILTVVFLVSNLVVDILYAALDPRIRYE